MAAAGAERDPGQAAAACLALLPGRTARAVSLSNRKPAPLLLCFVRCKTFPLVTSPQLSIIFLHISEKSFLRRTLTTVKVVQSSQGKEQKHILLSSIQQIPSKILT